MDKKKVRIGILGTLRGKSYIIEFKKQENCVLTAICENNPHSLETAKDEIGEDVKIFDNYDEFLDSGLFDAVMLCNYFFEHTKFAIKAMEKGIHVLSECTPAITMAECVELCETVERTGCKYMLAENYPLFASNLEMKRIFETGTMGDALYCEGEYNHPVTAHDKNMLAPGELHWRNLLPRPYYLTHALAPIVNITNLEPEKVNCKCVFNPNTLKGTACRVGDLAAIILVELSNGALARVTGCAAWGGHGNWYRICGEKGNMENVRGETEHIRVQYNSWNIPEGEEETSIKETKFYDDEKLNAKANESGHGGGDFWVAFKFIQYLNDELDEPYFDVYRSVRLSATAIQALRSAQNHGAEYEVPDFRNAEAREKYRNDHDCPFPDENGNITMACCSKADYMPTEEDIANAKKEWEEAGLNK